MNDTYEKLTCPACGKTMSKIYLNSKEFFVDVCLDGCGGIWFDNRELNKVDEKSEDINELSDALKDKEFKNADKTETRYCPICKQKMVKNCVSAKQAISIDECYLCGGKFFDYNELDEMRGQYENETERIEDIKKIAQDSESMAKMLDSVLKKDGECIQEY